MIEANIPMQELEGQRGEGAYFREDTVYTCRLSQLLEYVARLITPHACTRGKAIGLSRHPSVVIVGTKIARS